MGSELSSEFKTLLILSEILIPVIIFIGAYFILKPTFFPDKKKDEKADETESQCDTSPSTIELVLFH